MGEKVSLKQLKWLKGLETKVGFDEAWYSEIATDKICGDT
jgi:hypothetical protein